MKKTVVVMAQLNNNQRVFVVERFFRTNSFKQVRDEFSLRFPGRRPPSKSTIQRNVEKYRTHATSLNRNTYHSKCDAFDGKKSVFMHRK